MKIIDFTLLIATIILLVILIMDLVKRLKEEIPYTERVKINKCRDNAILPSRKHQHDAGYDLYACLDEDVIVPAGETVKIPTGIRIALPNDCFGAIYARSGLATKYGIRPANAVGVCDAPYRDEYIVALHNDGNENYTVKHGDRIAQLIVTPYVSVNFKEVDALNETERGMGGFGSTGR